MNEIVIAIAVCTISIIFCLSKIAGKLDAILKLLHQIRDK